MGLDVNRVSLSSSSCSWFCYSMVLLQSSSLLSLQPLLLLLLLLLLLPGMQKEQVAVFWLRRGHNHSVFHLYSKFCIGHTEQCPCGTDRLVGLVVKASSSRAEGPGFESCWRWDFFGVESNQWLKNWHSSGYPARRLALWGQHWDWSARCQYTVTGWGRTFDLQLVSQCGST